MNKFFSQKRTLLLLSSFLFLAGIVLFNGETDYSIVRFVNHTFSLSLNETFRAIGLGYLATFLIFSGAVCFVYVLFLAERINQEQFFFISIALLVCHYAYYVVKNAVNYPVYDDQAAIVEFLNQYPVVGTISEKVKYIFIPYNESFMILPRIFILAVWRLFHEINFRTLICLNVFGVILFNLFLLKIVIQRSDFLKYALVLPLFILQLQYFDTIFWVISGICYYWVLIFALASFYILLQRESKRRFLALAFACAATFTFSNGILVFPLCILYLIRKKCWSEFFIWLLTAGLFAFLYATSIPKMQFIGGIGFEPSKWIPFITALLGSAFQFFYTLHIPVLVGCLILFIFSLSFIKKRYAQSPAIFFLLAFLILSVIMASPFRTKEYGIEYALQVRYGFFSICAAVLALALLIENVKRARNFKVIFAMAIAYNLLSGIFFYPEVPIRTQRIIALRNEARNQKFETKFSAYHEKDFVKLMQEAAEKGIYKP